MKTAPDAATGYLARLVERVLPGETLLRRRQPSLFEPAQPWAGARQESAVSELEAEVPSLRPRTADADPAWPAAIQAPRAPPLLSQTPQPQRDLASEAAAPARAAATPALVERLVRHETSVLREAPRPDASLRVSARSASPSLQAQPAAPSAAAAPPARATKADASPAYAVAPPPTKVGAAAAPAALPRAEATLGKKPHEDEAPGLRRARSAEAPPVPHPRPAAPLLVPARAASRNVAPAVLRQNSALPPRALPPVEVTIGRIEVRAVTAAPGAARAQSAAPRLSLEQYLHDRNGGGR